MTNGEYIHERMIIKNNLSFSSSSILTLSIYVGCNENFIFCIATNPRSDIDYFLSRIEYRYNLCYPQDASPSDYIIFLPLYSPNFGKEIIIPKFICITFTISNGQWSESKWFLVIPFLRDEGKIINHSNEG